MATIKAFNAIRPRADLAQRVAALPYDVMNRQEAKEMVKDNPYSFLHIDRAEIDLDDSVNQYSDEVYNKAKENFHKFIEDGTFIKDCKPYLYIYQLEMNGRTQTGLVACTSIYEYLDNKIKKHELTRKEKEEDRIKHVDKLNANTGPIFLSYKDNLSINETINSWISSHKPVYDFVAEDNITHKAYIIDDNTVIDKLINEFKAVDSLYIADGHHRNASAVNVGLKRSEKGKDLESDYYLSVIFPASQLHILDYNRLIKDIPMSKEEFFNKLSEKFNFIKKDCTEAIKPSKPHCFGMYLDGKWYELEYKQDLLSNDPILSLDVSILQNEVLAPILNIQDPRIDDRISFVGGIRGLKELERKVNSHEYTLAFSMYPTSMEELFRVADNNLIMPPKSTWFEPKLRSGLFIHSLI